jgi:hypothetical protein
VDGLSSGAQAFAEQVFRVGSWRGELPPTTSFSLDGAGAMSELVLRHPAIADGLQPEMQLRLFGASTDRGLDRLRRHSVGYLVSGAVSLGVTRGEIGDELATGLIHAAADPVPDSLLLRANLLRERLFEPPPPLLPEWLEQIERFIDRECFAGVMKAVLELGRWAGTRSTSYSTGIRSVTPSVCGNREMTLSGTFPTTQPADVAVYVPTLGGGCRAATVERWSDVAVTVRSPEDIAPGCVGFVKLTGAYFGPQNVTGELTACVGAAAQAWARGFDRVQTPPVSCPPCLPQGENRIQAGAKPIVYRFRFTPDLVEPGGRPTLEWNVSNASDVQITRLGGPPLALPTPVPLSGMATLAPVVGLTPVTGQYRLTATNGCGVTTADAEFSMRRTPLLSITGIEVVQAIQTPTNTVRLAANRRTAVRVFVDSGISDGFDFGTGLGPNRVDGLVAMLTAENLDTGAVFDCGSPWPGTHQAGPALNRDVLRESINFDVPLAACMGNVDFRVTVMLPGPTGTAPTSVASGSVQVTFKTLSSQMFLPFLVTDPSSTSPPPTMADLFVCLTGPAELHPFPENGFTLNPALAYSLSGVQSLTTKDSWNWVLMSIQTNTFLFASQPVGGVRIAIVPNDPSYAWDGLAFPRTGAGVPTMLVKAGDAETCAHELAHAAGLLHVNCGGPAGPYGGLPFKISDPGLNVTTRGFLPSGTTNELMSYCWPRWPSILHWEHMFNSIPFS